MYQNYPPHGGTGAAGGGGGGDQSRGQIPGFSRDRGGSRNRRRGVEQGQRGAVEPEDFLPPREPERVYRYGDRYEQDVRLQGDQRPPLHNYQQPLRQYREEHDHFGPYDDWSMQERREPYPEQISGYEHRGSQRPLEQVPMYGDRGNQLPPPTPGELFGRNQRGFTPPRQSSVSRYGRYPYHEPPVRVPQAQNRPPSQAPNRASTYQTSNTGNSQTSLPDQPRGGFMGIPHGSNAGGRSKNPNPNPNSRKRKRKHTTQSAMSTETVAGANNGAKKIKIEDDNANAGHERQNSLHSGNKGSVNDGNFKNTKAMTGASTKAAITSHTVEAQGRNSLREDLMAKQQIFNVVKMFKAIFPSSAGRLSMPREEELAQAEATRIARERERIGMDVCGNCADRSHVVADCNKPQSDGLIHGCAICNANYHTTWGCPQFPTGNGTILEQLKELVFKRANRPPLHGRFWYHLMYPYMQAHPDTEVPGLPWTKEFSQPYHASSMLQHKLRFEMDNDEEVTVDPKTSTWEAAVAHYGVPVPRRTKSRAKH